MVEPSDHLVRLALDLHAMLLSVVRVDQPALYFRS